MDTARLNFILTSGCRVFCIVPPEDSCGIHQPVHISVRTGKHYGKELSKVLLTSPYQPGSDETLAAQRKAIDEAISNIGY
jgi:hypothetical protein